MTGNYKSIQRTQTNKRVDHLSEFARAELEKRYPNALISRAIDMALERLRTLEQVQGVSSYPQNANVTEGSNV